MTNLSATRTLCLVLLSVVMTQALCGQEQLHSLFLAYEGASPADADARNAASKAILEYYREWILRDAAGMRTDMRVIVQRVDSADSQVSSAASGFLAALALSRPTLVGDVLRGYESDLLRSLRRLPPGQDGSTKARSNLIRALSFDQPLSPEVEVVMREIVLGSAADDRNFEIAVVALANSASNSDSALETVVSAISVLDAPKTLRLVRSLSAVRTPHPGIVKEMAGLLSPGTVLRSPENEATAEAVLSAFSGFGEFASPALPELRSLGSRSDIDPDLRERAARIAKRLAGQ